MSYLSPISGLVLALDKPVLVVLLDGTHLYGILTSVDPYENIVIEQCFERVFIDHYYAENELGLQIIQGHNIAFVSEIKGTLDNCPIEGLQKLSLEEYVEYMDLSEEERLAKNNGEKCSIASNCDYKVTLVL